MDAKVKRASRLKRHRRVRKRVSGTADCPRLVVYRSNRHIYAQLVDDTVARTLVHASDTEAKAKGDKKERAKAVGTVLAKRASEAGIGRAIFDRGGRLYHGRVAALAEGARKGGLTL
ncbi:MAG: 50S ribosomal protein L18 [Actinomycetota bacterium]